MTQCFVNPAPGTPGIVVLPTSGFRRARATIAAWPGYAPTALHDLPALAGLAAVAAVGLKDESCRFGLGGMAVGGAYAAGEVVASARARSDAPITVTCATAGDHGRGVAWSAARAGARCVVFLPDGADPARADAITRLGAEIRPGGDSYDEAIHRADEAAQRHGWLLVSDTARPGDTEVPRLVMQGYRLMADEALDQGPGEPPTHVIVQAGGGALAAAISVQMRARCPTPPKLIVVEPTAAACLLTSARRGELASVDGTSRTAMTSLAYGTPSLLAWQELARAASAFLAVMEAEATVAMAELARLGISATESGAAGLAGLLALAADPESRAALELDRHSRVLLFNTEGTPAP